MLDVKAYVSVPPLGKLMRLNNVHVLMLLIGLPKNLLVLGWVFLNNLNTLSNLYLDLSTVCTFLFLFLLLFCCLLLVVVVVVVVGLGGLGGGFRGGRSV